MLRRVALCLLFVSSVDCGRSSSPMAPDPVVLDQRYVFACGRWSPEQPPVTGALVDLRMHGQTVDGRPTPEAIRAITAAGGRIAQAGSITYAPPAVNERRSFSVGVVTGSQAHRYIGTARMLMPS